jgi:hypothetical protein
VWAGLQRPAGRTSRSPLRRHLGEGAGRSTRKGRRAYRPPLAHRDPPPSRPHRPDHGPSDRHGDRRARRRGQRAGIAWWEELTGRRGEGMLVMPVEVIHSGPKGITHPGIECRGPEYLRIICGPRVHRGTEPSPGSARAVLVTSARTRSGSSRSASKPCKKPLNAWWPVTRATASTNASLGCSPSRANPSTRGSKLGARGLTPGSVAVPNLEGG